MEASEIPTAYVSRDEYILSRCRGKRVLHLGCLGETCRAASEREAFFLTSRSLHARLGEVSARLVGVDLESEALTALQRAGYPDVYGGDVENLNDVGLPSIGFDVVVAGDIIEHLSNPGRMLDGIRDILERGGELVVTTPNAYGLPNYLRFLKGNLREGADHVQSYSPFTLGYLLARHGWSVSSALSCHQARAESLSGRTAFAAGRWILRQFPKLGGTLLFVCRPSEAASK
jgi:2-polyprenyl-3-methyl-5-hydroxy-6-metoxy-1,4-benzoquinol methylase